MSVSHKILVAVYMTSCIQYVFTQEQIQSSCSMLNIEMFSTNDIKQCVALIFLSCNTTRTHFCQGFCSTWCITKMKVFQCYFKNHVSYQRMSNTCLYIFSEAILCRFGSFLWRVCVCGLQSSECVYNICSTWLYLNCSSVEMHECHTYSMCPSIHPFVLTLLSHIQNNRSRARVRQDQSVK